MVFNIVNSIDGFKMFKVDVMFFVWVDVSGLGVENV